jgi:Plavaka transposase
MYETIDAVQLGSLPFKTHRFYYKGPKPSTPPSWMEEGYDIDVRDALAVVRDQLATLAFKDQFDYVPYQEFNSKGERIWSNLMSAQWAFKQAVCSLCLVFRITFLIPLSRMSSHKTETTMGLCLYPLLPEATRQLFRSRRVIKNTTPSTFR